MITPKLTMRDGVEIPSIGFGTALIRGVNAVRLIQQTIDFGYELIDSAYNYENEGVVGRAIRQSSVPREKLFVTSKLPGRFHKYSQAIETIQESLYRAGLDYYDLYLIHWPNPSVDEYVEAWQALIDARRFGLVRSIGLSNFTPEHIDRLEKETGVLPAINQVELHPGYSQTALRAYHERKGILTEAWSPLGQGGEILKNPLIQTIAAAHDKNIGQVILRWEYQLGVLPIPRSANFQRQKSNLAIFDFELTQEEMAIISELDNHNWRMGPDPLTHKEM